jgi:hypothetical protein
MTFPGIVVVTARGKDVAALDSAGRPVEGSKEYRVEGQKNLAFDATVWIRVSRDHAPVVVGARSVHAGVRPGVDKPRPVPGLTLEKVVFDVLRCNPAEAEVRQLVEPATVEPELDAPAEPVQEEPPPAARTGMVTGDQHKRMHANWRHLGFDGDHNRDLRLQITSKLIGRGITSSTQLTAAEADTVIEGQEAKRRAARERGAQRAEHAGAAA